MDRLFFYLTDSQIVLKEGSPFGVSARDNISLIPLICATLVHPLRIVSCLNTCEVSQTWVMNRLYILSLQSVKKEGRRQRCRHTLPSPLLFDVARLRMSANNSHSSLLTGIGKKPVEFLCASDGIPSCLATIHVPFFPVEKKAKTTHKEGGRKALLVLLSRQGLFAHSEGDLRQRQTAVRCDKTRDKQDEIAAENYI